MWYREMIGGNRCPITDTWWQTETGNIMIAPIPGAIATKPGSATKPFPGVAAEIVTMDGQPVPLGSGGFLVITKPWPGMLRTVYGDPDRYVKNYWSQIPGYYFTGDGARRDKDGYFWIMGRVDDEMCIRDSSRRVCKPSAYSWGNLMSRSITSLTTIPSAASFCVIRPAAR